MVRVKQFVEVRTVTAARNGYKLPVSCSYCKGDKLTVGILESSLDDRQFHVVARNMDGNTVTKLVNGPWFRQTARRHARDFARHLGNDRFGITE